MLTSSLIFLNAMIDAAKWFSAKKLRSSFSYRTRSFRNRLNQLCATSTTHRLAFFSGSRLSSLASCLLPSALDVRNVAMVLNDVQSRCAGVARVGTQMLVSSLRWIGSLDNDGIQHGFKLRYIMSVCSGHDERQRDATTVHQQIAFAPIFFPYRWDWVQRFPVPVAPSSSPRQYFAIARQCLQIRRTRQAPVSTGLQRRLLFPTPGTGHESRWHCRSARRGALSTGTL